MAPFDRIEDLHNFTWGALGYNHLDAARRQGQAALGGALDFLSRGTGLPAEAPGDRVAIVFNARPWPRTDLVSTGQIHALPPRTREIVIRDRAGRIVPSQYAEIDRDADGNLTMAEAVFPAKDVPAAGYDSYGLEFSGEAAPLPATALRFDEEKLVLENEYVRVRLDPKTGAIAGLEGTAAGGDALDPTNGAFPRFTGRPTKALSTRPDPPDQYDSAASQARIDWTSRGPLWATVRAQHSWPYLKFETRVTLAAGRPYVEAVVRVLAQVPPKTDDNPPDIKEGYWLSFARGGDEEPGVPRPDLGRSRGTRPGPARPARGDAVFPERGGRPRLQPDHARMGIALHRRVRLAVLRRIPVRIVAARWAFDERRPAARSGRVLPAARLRSAGAPAGRCIGLAELPRDRRPRLRADRFPKEGRGRL
jgi:hypothetical protein